MYNLFKKMKWLSVVCLVLYIIQPLSSIFTPIHALAATTPRSENFDSVPTTMGLTGLNIINDWTFGFINKPSNQSKIQVRNLLPNTTNDLLFFGYLNQGGTDYGIVKSNTGAFKLNSFRVYERNNPSNQYTIQGFLSGQPVSGALKTFTPASGSFETVDVSSDPAWQNIDEFRIFASSTIKFDFDDLNVTDPVVSEVPKYSVTYNGNGNDGGNIPTDSTQYTKDASVTVPSPGTLTKSGYTFKGWNTQADGLGTSYAAGDTFNISGTTTLYAQWSKNPPAATYILAYYDNGSDEGEAPTDSTLYAQNASVILASPGTLTKTGYTFTGWNTQVDGQGTSYVAGATFNITEDTILFAQWSKNPPAATYSVTYNGNGNDGGNVPTDSTQYTQNASVTVGEPGTLTKTGYTFEGWNTQPDGKGTKFSSDEIFTIDRNMTLFAQWSIKQYTVSFHSNGGNSVDSMSADYSTKITSPSDPTQVGYTFEGWYKDSNLTTPWSFDNDSVTEDTTLYAKWKVNSYNVTFDTNGGDSIGSKSTEYNTTITSPTEPTKTGYTFEGWYKDKNLTIPWSFDNDSVTEDTTLYAKWKVSNYDVSFNTDGGSSVLSIKTNYNTTISTPEEPTKTGYTFVGWYKDSELTEAWNFTTDKVTQNTTLYGKWTIKNFTIMFDTNGGSTVEGTNANYNTKITSPNNPTKDGYTFEGWYKDSNLSTPWSFENDPIKEDTTLYAKWSKQNYTVQFNTYGGSSIQAGHVEYGEKVTKPSDPTKEGYNFLGWYTEPNLLTLFDFEQAIKNDTTLNAKWGVNLYVVDFNTNEGSKVASITTDYNTSISIPTEPKKTGYTFVGWYKDSELNDAWDFATDKVTQNTTLYVKWKLNSYEVSFETNGGTQVESTAADYNTKITPPNEPIRLGYTFGGWYKDTDLITQWSFEENLVTENTKLYAKWISNDAKLSSITITNNVNLSPAFNSLVTNYTSSVGNEVTNVIITPIKSDTNATMTVNGNVFITPTPINLKVGENIITIVVTAQVGTSKVYMITINRASVPTYPNLPPTDEGNTGDTGNTRQVDVTVGQDRNETAAKIDIVRKIDSGIKVDEVLLDNMKAQEVVQRAVDQKKDTSTIILTDLPQDKADEMKINVKKEAVDLLGNHSIALQIETPNVSVSLPKETVQALNQFGNDLYFRVVPIRKVEQQEKVIQETLDSHIVKQSVGEKAKDIKIYGNPMTIETNYTNYKTYVIFPLKDLSIPSDPIARETLLNSLRVYVKHTDGTEELLKGEIGLSQNGNPDNLKIQISKFSTFTLLGVPNTDPTPVPKVSDVAISGAKIVGSTLKGSYNYSDVDLDPEGKSVFKWYRADNLQGLNKQEIDGANLSTYQLTKKDIGKYIAFEVLPVASKGGMIGKAITSTFIGPITQKNTAPTVSGVTIKGSTTVDKTLYVTYKYNDADGDKEGQTIIKWYRVDQNNKTKELISLNKSSYTLTSKDISKYIVVEVIPVAKSGVINGLKKTTKESMLIEPAKIDYDGHVNFGLIRSKTYVEKVGNIIKSEYQGLVMIKKSGSYYQLSAKFRTKKEALEVSKKLKARKLIINYYIK